MTRGSPNITVLHVLQCIQQAFTSYEYLDHSTLPNTTKWQKDYLSFSSTDNNNYYYCLHLQITTSEFAMLSSFKMQHYRHTFHWQQMSQMPQGKTYGKEIWDMIEFFKFKYKHNLVAVFLNFVLDFSFVCNLYQFTTPIIMSALDNGSYNYLSWAMCSCFNTLFLGNWQRLTKPRTKTGLSGHYRGTKSLICVY